jgi:hypothetical protein
LVPVSRGVVYGPDDDDLPTDSAATDEIRASVRSNEKDKDHHHERRTNP